MKKIFALCLVLVLALSVFVACGENSTNTDSVPAGTNSGALSGTNTDSANANTDSSNANTDSANTNTNSGTAVIPDGELNEDNIVGDWTFTMNLKDVVPSYGMDADFTCHMVFTAEKKVSLYMAEDDLWKAVEDATRSLMTKEYIAQASGITVEQLEAALQQEGKTWEAYVEEAIEVGIADMKNSDTSPFPTADANGNIVMSEGNFKMENGKLYISNTDTFTEDQGASYTYAGGKLTITEDGVSMVMTKQ